MDVIIKILGNKIEKIFVLLNNRFCENEISDVFNELPFLNLKSEEDRCIVEKLEEDYYLFVSLLHMMSNQTKKIKSANMLYDLYIELKQIISEQGICIEVHEKTRETASHISQIIGQLGESKSRIPEFIIKLVTEYAISEKYIIDFNKKLEEQISEETKQVLIYIYQFLK